MPSHCISRLKHSAPAVCQAGGFAFGYHVPLQQEQKDPHSVQLCYKAALQHLWSAPDADKWEGNKKSKTWDLAKSQGWNVKFSNSGICSTTFSQHTDFSEGITDYQPLSEGALSMRLALVLAGGMAQTGGDTATTAQLTGDEGQLSSCSRSALSKDRINSADTSSAPDGA